LLNSISTNSDQLLNCIVTAEAGTPYLGRLVCGDATSS
jgi:hypothetical protein